MPACEREAALSLLTASAVRERAREMLALGRVGALPHFVVDEAKLAPTADYVAAVMRANYPDLRVPLHARWRHFIFDGRDLWIETAAKANWRDPAARARAEFDLAIVSVLLNAGAGPDWRYSDAAKGLEIGRSEGLEIDFAIDGEREPGRIFTTRPDTLMGATFLCLAAEHPLALKAASANPRIQEFIDECRHGGVACDHHLE